jgi:hypothetical protein
MLFLIPLVAATYLTRDQSGSYDSAGGDRKIDCYQIWDQITHGPGPGSIDQGQQAATRLKASYNDRVTTIDKLSRDMDAAWTGKGAAAAQDAGAHPLKAWIQDSGTKLTDSDKYLGDQHTAFTTVAAKVQEVPQKPPDNGFLNSITPWETDTDRAIKDYNRNGQANVDAFNEYYKASTANSKGLPTYSALDGSVDKVDVSDGGKNGKDDGKKHDTGTGDGNGTGNGNGGGYQPGNLPGGSGGGYQPGNIPGGGGAGSGSGGGYTPPNIPGGGGYHPGNIPGGGGYQPGNMPVGSGYTPPNIPGGTTAAGYTPPSIPGADYSGGGFGPGASGSGGSGGGGFGPGGSGSGDFGPGGSGSMGGIGAGGFGPGSSTGAAPGSGIGGAGAGAGAGGAGAAAAGKAGAGGMSGMGGMHGAKGGKGGGDEDRSSKYLMGDDPNDLFGTDELTAPPVIGE